jgi:hypothetical protein
VNEAGHWAVFVARDLVNGAVVVFARRLNPDCLEQDLGRYVMGMGDERDGHPTADGLILPPDAPGVPACPVPENERAGNRQQECESEYETEYEISAAGLFHNSMLPAPDAPRRRINRYTHP